MYLLSLFLGFTAGVLLAVNAILSVITRFWEGK